MCVDLLPQHPYFADVKRKLNAISLIRIPGYPQAMKCLESVKNIMFTIERSENLNMDRLSR
jgi:hypothetical protein